MFVFFTLDFFLNVIIFHMTFLERVEKFPKKSRLFDSNPVWSSTNYSYINFRKFYYYKIAVWNFFGVCNFQIQWAYEQLQNDKIYFAQLGINKMIFEEQKTLNTTLHFNFK